VRYYTTGSVQSLFLLLVLEEALGILKIYMDSFPEGGRTAVLQNVTRSSGCRFVNPAFCSGGFEILIGNVALSREAKIWLLKSFLR